MAQGPSLVVYYMDPGPLYKRPLWVQVQATLKPLSFLLQAVPGQAGGGSFL